ncbi:MAG: acetolactate synthase large subunit [Acidimicrobiales bacterium]
MNGGQALLQTLARAGVQVCFANPGTSEMHTVFALDSIAGIRAVLCLEEGVATGAADGYARMAGVPATTLLHLGPGLANGWANLHNARRALSPVVNVVGDHATYHKRFDAPLESDIDGLAWGVSRWVRRPSRAADVGADTADAVAAAMQPPGGVATLILPADVAWQDGALPGVAHGVAERGAVPESMVRAAASAVARGSETVLLLGGACLREPGLRAASRLAEATGVRVLVETHVAHLQRGAGRPEFASLGYFSEMAEPQLAGARQLVTAGAATPVAFFAYPGRPSSFVPDGCRVVALGAPEHDVAGALEELAERLAPGVEPRLAGPGPGPGRSAWSADAARPLDAALVGAVVGASLPGEAIVVEESVTARLGMAQGTAAAAPHDWLALTGGAIGAGLPLATGAALACPDRPVVCLEADGSAMYTVQALWTQARENLDVTTVVLSNRSYAILRVEMSRIVAQAPGPRAAATLDLSGPALNFAALAEGMGVEATRVTTAAGLADALGHGLARSGPFLIDADITGRA